MKTTSREADQVLERKLLWLDESRISGRGPGPEFEEEMSARQSLYWVGGYGRDGYAGKIQANRGSYLDDMMGRSTKRAVMIGLPGGMAMSHLNDTRRQQQRDADHSQQSQPGGA